MGTKANKIWFLAVTVLILFGLAGCFADQLNQGQQQGCAVKIWNEYQYFAIRPVEDTALIPAGQKQEDITFMLETTNFASSTIENAEDSICVTVTTADGETIQYPLRLTMLMFHGVDPEELS